MEEAMSVCARGLIRRRLLPMFATAESYECVSKTCGSERAQRCLPSLPITFFSNLWKKAIGKKLIQKRASTELDLVQLRFY